MKITHLLLLLCCCLPFPATQAATIGIVHDGPEAWYFLDQVDAFKTELAKRSKGGAEVNYKEFKGNWTAENIKNALDQALSDPEIDIVYTAGMVASMIARNMNDQERTKPIFGGAVQYSDAGSYPITAESTSSVKNFAFIASPQRVLTDLELILRLKKVKTIDVMIDALFLNQMEQAEDIATLMGASLNIKLRFIPGGSTVESYLSKIPADAEAIYVSILGRLNETQRKELYTELQQRNLINVSMAGERELELGAMAALATDLRKPIALRIALNLQQLIQGTDTSALPVYIPVEDRLSINMTAAKNIGWSPDYEMALEALFIGMGALQDGEKLTIADAMNLAAEQNIELTIAEDGLRTQQAAERRTKSNLLPNLSLTGEYGQTEIGSKIDPMGPDEVHGGNYGVQLSQILFNDAAWSGNKAAKAGTRAQELAVAAARLDAMESAGVSFLQLLLNQALYRIQQKNLRLTDNNVRLARLRQSIGAADASEVYRWESSAAQDRSALFQQDGEVRKSLASLNRILGISQDKVWLPENIELTDDNFAFLDEERPFVKNTYAEFLRYRDYLKQRAISDSIELQQFDAALEAQGYTVKQTGRKRFMPEVSGLTTFKQAPQGSNLTDDEEQSEWFIGIVASIPLFEGGGIKAQAEEEKAKLRELEHQREQALQFIEQQAVDVWSGIGAQHPAIRLSRQSRDAAENAYFVVRDKYTQGAASILDMLDAQVQLLRQEQQAAQALYTYLINNIRLQRVVSWFEHAHSPEEQQTWADELHQFLQQKETP